MTDQERQEIIDKIEDNTFYEVDYPCSTVAYFDEDNNAYYNRSGQRLRDPKEYDRTSEGYTPFGDE